jgi:hypothetical protein
MNKAMKIVLACLICVAVIAALVMAVRWIAF